MLAYRDGDAAAFEWLYGRWRGRLYRYLARQAPAHADELFQDVWLRVIRAREGYEATARFSTWLFRIGHNRLMDHYRGGARAVVVLFEVSSDEGREGDPIESVPAPDQEAPLAMLERKEMARHILAALEALPEPQREAFLMSEEAGMGVDEIAVATGVGRETAKSRLRYAMARLRAALGSLRNEEMSRGG